MHAGCPRRGEWAEYVTADIYQFYYRNRLLIQFLISWVSRIRHEASFRCYVVNTQIYTHFMTSFTCWWIAPCFKPLFWHQWVTYDIIPVYANHVAPMKSRDLIPISAHHTCTDFMKMQVISFRNKTFLSKLKLVSQRDSSISVTVKDSISLLHHVIDSTFVLGSFHK